MGHKTGRDGSLASRSYRTPRHEAGDWWLINIHITEPMKETKTVTISDLFRKLGAPLANVRTSWGSVRESDGAVFLRVWSDQIKTIKVENREDMTCVRITNHEKRKAQAEEGTVKKGWTERLGHIELINNGAKSYCIKCKAKDKTADTREIAGFEDRECLVGGELVERDGDYWLEIVGKKLIRKIADERGERRINVDLEDSELSEDTSPQDKILQESEITDPPKLDEPLQDVGVFVARGVNPEKPGIYVFVIEGQGIYVGIYTWPSRYKQEYSKNVRNLLDKKPYRPKNPDGFRTIHRALAKAVGTEKQKISLILIENWDDEESGLRRERELINTIGTLND